MNISPHHFAQNIKGSDIFGMYRRYWSSLTASETVTPCFCFFGFSDFQHLYYIYCNFAAQDFCSSPCSL